jgi:CRISPR-associated protein Cmr4
MERRAFLVHALSPLHPGTGQSVGHIDLPIARYKATNIPYLPGSSIKGVLRDGLRPPTLTDAERKVIFGPEWGKSEADSNAGSLTVGDARLLLLPVRSLRGTFAYVTSPLLLRLARNDLTGAPPIPTLPAGKRALVVAGSTLLHKSSILLEDLVLAAQAEAAQQPTAKWAELLGKLVFGTEASVLVERFAVVDDEAMTFLWETCTQVDARVRIDDKTGVVSDGALWYEESLPAETVLVGLASAETPRGPSARVVDAAGAPLDSAVKVLDKVFSAPREDLQLGGKSTVGRGRVRLLPQGANAHQKVVGAK